MGFNREGINKDTGTKYNLEGYNIFGYDKDGYNEEGYNRQGFSRMGFNREGINKDTGTKYDLEGYDINGYNEEGYNKNGYNHEGYDKDGYDKEGYNKIEFNRDGINKTTGLKYNEYGFDYKGINSETGTEYDKEGYDINGKTADGFTRATARERSQRYAIIIDMINKLVSGELVLEQYKRISKLKISELLRIAKDSHMSSDTISKLRKLEKEDLKYLKAFTKDIVETTSFIIDDKEVKLSTKRNEVLDVIKYLCDNKVYLCSYTFKKYMKLYLMGEFDLNISFEENLKNLAKSDDKSKKNVDGNTKEEMGKLKKAKLDALIKKANASKNINNKKTIS